MPLIDLVWEMATYVLCMDMKHKTRSIESLSAEGFLSEKVQHADYYYQTLTPGKHDQLVVVCGGVEHCRPDYVVNRNDFRYYSIEYVAKGRGTLELEGKCYELSPGAVFCYGPGRAHKITTVPTEPMVKYFVDFAGVEAERLLKEFLFYSHPVQTRSPVHIVESLEAIAQSANRDSSESREICALLLCVLCRRVAEEIIPPALEHGAALQTYIRCVSIIESGYMEFKGLQDISAACHVVPAYLCRLFKRYGDYSPGQYLLRLRMKYAANRLQDASALVQQVAQELGYSDAFHFSRAFKRTHGLSPQQFRQLAVRASY
jgi:AraC-like DNA-binding protein